MKRAVNIDRQRLAQVRIEIGQAGTVDHQIQVRFQPLQGLRLDTQTRLRDVSFDNFGLFGQESAKTVAVPDMQILKQRRFGDDLLEAARGGRRTLAAYEQIYFGDIG